ncbi:MAG: hypothetical protein P4L65_08065 [Legionella sp.]|nr:hypothetical protein [Legionella sp.]
MNLPNDKDPYEAQIRIGNKIISTVTGKNISELQAFLSERCELEESGTEGQIIEMSTGNVIYSCRKQTIIDE